MKCARYRGRSPRQSSRPVPQYPEPMLTISTLRIAEPVFDRSGASSPCLAKSSESRIGAATGNSIIQCRIKSALNDEMSATPRKIEEPPIVLEYELS